MATKAAAAAAASSLPPPVMRALVASGFGAPRAVLSLQNDRPVPAAPTNDEVQIHVHAAAVHAGDWRLIRGDPYLVRLMFGRVAVPGCELAGVVTAVGPAATRLRPGDRVLADASESGFGAFAGRVTVPQAHAARVPPGVPMQTAAATVTSALAALQAVRAVGGLTAEDRVLVTGASGGVGHFVVQLARNAGAYVTAVCRAEKAAAVRALGAQETVEADKMLEDNVGAADAGGEKPFTAIIDAACYVPPAQLIGKVLRRDGRYVLVGGQTGLLFRTMFLSGWMQWRLKAKVSVLMSKPTAEDLDELARLLEAGSIAPHIDRVFQFDDIIDAIEHVEGRKVVGKVVVDLEGNNRGDEEDSEK